MKRMHLHVSVPELESAIRFYSRLFASEPAVVKDDYAKWMLEDPWLNFAVSVRGAPVGLNHLGIQVDAESELEAMGQRLEEVDAEVRAEMDTLCCYAHSDKYWTTDPAGIAWETYRTLGSIPMFGAESEPAVDCCTPEDAAPAARSRPAGNGTAGCC